MKVRLLYISISGNTRSFVQRLVAYAASQNQYEFIPVEISDASMDAIEMAPYFAIVPTYLEGGTGTGPNVHELLTFALSDYIAYMNNANYLLGLVGSGNKNFDDQYVLTAKRYAQMYQVPLLADYELRGLPDDVQYVYQALVQRLVEWQATSGV